MTKYKDWTEDEFRAYLFLYAADSNFEYNAEEKSFIESKFDLKTIGSCLWNANCSWFLAKMAGCIGAME